MNKTLILAFTIAFATFGCTEEEATSSDMADEVVTSNATSETVTSSEIDETVLSSTTDNAEVSDQAVAANTADKEVIYDAMNQMSFQAIDTNLDGVINRMEAEADTKLLGAFITLDLDKTGDLNEVEYNKFVMLTK
ncbi:MAG: hypothetical protein ACJAT7_001810 [Psychromonas sp.]|jgi:hypothetical protein|uniref:hypothetical protein n=1 Tax=Psychromonas sp. TaxID=1884585 RepID=UPI0039E2C578